MAIYTPPDYMSLYAEQVEINAKLKREIKNVIEDMRDEFAKVALIGILSNSMTHKQVLKYGNGLESITAVTADAAYQYADAMLKEKNKGLSI